MSTAPTVATSRHKEIPGTSLMRILLSPREKQRYRIRGSRKSPYKGDAGYLNMPHKLGLTRSRGEHSRKKIKKNKSDLGK